MKNKYMLRGILFLIAGIGLNLLGRVAENNELDIYKLEMLIGTLLFGIGFLLIFYSLIRKVERQAILEERTEGHEKMHKLSAERDSQQ
jgi:hypothetical protein